MAAATQASIATSAVVFAGGLAVGIGGALALSRGAFAPSTKPNRKTGEKARKGLNLPNGQAVTAKDVPASEVLDGVDQKGAGPVGAQPNGIVKPVIANSKTNKPAPVLSITGKELYPEPSNKNRVSDLETRMNPTEAKRENAAASEQANAQLPVCLTGSPQSNLLSTSTGQIDKIAYESSSAVFVYESQTNAGFGSYSEKEANDAQRRGNSHTKVVSMQTRAGAGAAIAGYLSENGNSSAQSTVDGRVVSALTNADGFLAMAPSLANLAAATNNRRLVLQVSAASQEREVISNNYSSVLAAASTVGEDISVVLSAGRQEAVDIASIVSSPSIQGHVAHVFDGAFAGPQLAKLNAPNKTEVKSASLSDALQASGYENFIYQGPESPSVLLIVPNGSHFEAAKTILSSANEEIQSTLGLIAARVIRPWSDEDLLKLIPSSVETIHVLDEVRVAGLTGVLFEDVQATIMSNILSAKGPTPIVQPIALHSAEHLSAGHWSLLLNAAATTAHKWQLDLDTIKNVEVKSLESDLIDQATKLVTFIDQDQSATATAGSLFARVFRDRNGNVHHSRLLSRFDNFTAGGLVRHDVLLTAPENSESAAQYPLQVVSSGNQSNALVIGDLAALKGYNVFESLKAGGVVLINAPGLNGLELASRLRAEDKQTLAAKNARVYLLDAPKVVDGIHSATAKARGGKHRMASNEVPKETAAVVLLTAVLNKFAHFNATAVKALLGKVLGTAPLGDEGVSGVVDGYVSGLQLVAFNSEEWKNSQPVNEVEASAPVRPTQFHYNAFSPLADAASLSADPSAARATWTLPAWQTMFGEAYNTDHKSLRPDLPEDNYVLTVTENRRLTPLDYDRNVFHMELSTAGTGLKYEVGEALGIHGLNDADEVRDFISWSGYDPDEIISVASLSDPTRYESRTVFQVLQQRLDIFGKPGRSFYETLSKLATDVDEAKWLRFVGSAEGQSTFKKLSEIETVTYADVLRMFPSARLPLDVLLTEVEAIKPRHYSIASAQSFVGDSVHLLIVTVDWRTPSGSPRYGQCTRYLANLKVGEQVTVSLKPSVMKLPPFTTQPIVMSGLGTGAAPFRAYIQARAVQKRQGHEIGPMIYIFGSRYKHAEYLYGEELEAYEKDGIVKVLTAFSRDQKHKIYIQNRIEQNQKDILDLLIPEKGAGEERKGLFTLCGPTDPLPDVQEALIKGYMSKTGKSHADGEAWLEELKEEERAVYEVY
ncbi:uncharacterized protein FA14DRAFT_162217 [Meira miltonrushii]|uniref:assimilatory sulfite reductase (NADPH) n=1 Tax=Meira miltonrushii TaxID=1280837 RepID=A0A316V6E7_9BASI|nr:uncharacterized protein FA14DRAFT_162217 [Meira miltonrushii]PWN33086.1 hypothetical protein FA14DRAFT_162217 [Meira miltonrushii]